MRRLLLVTAAAVAAGSLAIAGAPSAAGRDGLRFGGTRVIALDSPAATGADDPAPPAPGSYSRMSDEVKRSYWAYANGSAPIYVHPRLHSRRRTRTRLWTEDGFPEVYLLLRQYRDPQGRRWVELRIPGRPNGRMGWVLRGALDAFHLDRWRIVVNRHRLRMSIFYNGHLRRRVPVGIGKAASPTPAGRFWIRERFKIPTRSSPYWPYALGTADYSVLTDWPGGGVVGIHGDWGRPDLIPGRPSHGCIRLHDRDAGWVGTHVPVGTPLLITH